MAKKMKDSHVLQAYFNVDSREQEILLRDKLEQINGLSHITIQQTVPQPEGETTNG